MKSFNEIMKIRDEPESKDIPVEKRKFQIKKSDDEKMQAFDYRRWRSAGRPAA